MDECNRCDSLLPNPQDSVDGQLVAIDGCGFEGEGGHINCRGQSDAFLTSPWRSRMERLEGPLGTCDTTIGK
jgi:hypothetical protein